MGGAQWGGVAMGRGTVGRRGRGEEHSGEACTYGMLESSV